MPLVPSSIISAWYVRTSFVYRNFAFLFCNPLWQKPVPKGFSLCPFWWLSLFSLFVVRPFVYVILGFQALIRLLHLRGLIEWTDKMALKLAQEDGPEPLGTPTFLLTLFSGLIALLLSMLTTLYLSAAEIGMRTTLVLPLLNLVAMMSVSIYRSDNANGKCAVEVYSRLLLAGSVIVAAILHPHEALVSFLGYPWLAVVTAISLIGQGLWWTGHGLKIAALWVVHFGSDHSHFVLWSLALLTCAAIYGFVAMKLFSMSAPKSRVTLDIEERRKQVAKALAHKRDKNGSYLYGDDHGIPFWVKVLNSLTDFEDYLYAKVFDPVATADAIWAKAQARLDEWETRKRARDEKCQRATATLSKLFAPIATAAKHVMIFFAVVWQVIKAKKTGACPYMRFTD